jgi:replication factor C subunit 3/5
MHAE